MAMELARQTAYVHAWVVRDLGDVGVENLPASVFELPTADAVFGTVWMAVLVGCVVAISNLVGRTSGTSVAAVFRAGTLVWLAMFCFSWLSFLLLGLVSPALAAAALASCWVESLIAVTVAMKWPIGAAA